MDATVIVCTYNRCESLKRVLQDLVSQRIAQSIDWQVLVVDNNSKDDTKSIVEDYVKRYPGRFSYLFEGRQGKCQALNAGVGSAAGDVLAFTDDDVRIDPSWLESLLSVFDDPEVMGAGGRIEPVWESDKPAWLPTDIRLLRGPLVAFDCEDTFVSSDNAPFGANMAFRGEAFERFGGFKLELGPRPGSEIRGEDSEFCFRLLRQAAVIRYQPAALVHHGVPPERISKRFFLNWWFDKGRSDIIAAKDSGEQVASLSRVVLSAVKWIGLWLATGREVKRFERKLLAWYKLGALVELLRRGGVSAQK